MRRVKVAKKDGQYIRPVEPQDEPIFTHICAGSVGIVEAQLDDFQEIALLHNVIFEKQENG